jgi:glycosyltransferase involved in cell wall biosynthesis
MNKILAVGQTPPPLHGQGIMIEKMLKGDYGDIKLIHVRMGFSKDLDQVGRFRFGKLVELIRIIVLIIYSRLKYNVCILYYPPAGPNMIPVIRDITILIAVRWMFRKTIFQIHASGLSSIYENISGIFRFFYEKAFFYPDAVIRLSKYAPEDGKLLKAKKEYIIHNGIEDEFVEFSRKSNKFEKKSVNILFVGTMIRSKGVCVLLDACKILYEKGVDCTVNFVGQFASSEFESEVKQYISSTELEEMVHLLGVLEGEHKWEKYASADIFCFPSYYESETLSVVLIEALSFELPVVSTLWRGIPSIVKDGYNGFLVPIKNSEAIAEKLLLLIEDANLRIELGTNGRKKYLENFTLEVFHQRLRRTFEDVLSDY